MLSTSFLTDQRLAISRHALDSEAESVGELLRRVQPLQSRWPTIAADARELIAKLRQSGFGLSVEAFLEEYGLSSKEGVAIMCLAEALLRIPDRTTADALIESTFSGAEWDQHLGQSPSLYVNASSWGLLLTGKMLQFAQPKGGVRGLINNLLHRTSEPVIREALKVAMKLVANQFVMGEDMPDAIKRAGELSSKGYLFSYDMLGEGARSDAQADAYFAAYSKAIHAIAAMPRVAGDLMAGPSISIKLTALHPRYEWRKRDQLMQELYPRLKQLISQAKEAGIAVALDAEETARLDLQLMIYEALLSDPDLADYDGIGFVLQAYQKRAVHVADYLVSLAQQTARKLPVRLVKGAYWDSEIKWAQMNGLEDYPVFTVKAHSDLSYLACAQIMLGAPQFIYPQFATHNAVTIAAIRELAGEQDYEFQRLYGMGEQLYNQLVAGQRCRIYAPVGEHRDLLAYLIRRLLENGANSSFVHQVMDHDIPLEDLLYNPIEAAESGLSQQSILPSPQELYGAARRNSRGIETGYAYQLAEVETLLQSPAAVPAIALTNPADIPAMMQRAAHAQHEWDAGSAMLRASLLRQAADKIEAARNEWVPLLMQEAGKTLLDAIAEIREAADFCRYYASMAEGLFGSAHFLPGPTGEINQLSLHGRGVFVCISPWNFPLAIFTGQVAAVLAAGNSVIAKCAEQTPAIATKAVALLHQAGIPHDVLQLVIGDGAAMGKPLLDDAHLAGVAFTGSTETAQIINRQLAARKGAIIPLIAETGGLNAMIVDSSALPEQAADDIIASAFGNAGQRCSALRMLYIHEAIADNLISLLKGAMNRLVIGDPLNLTSDIGPVIDSDAQAHLNAHIDKLKAQGRGWYAAPLPQHLPSLPFVAPHLFEISGIEELEGEIFGPVLHVARYKPAEIDAVMAAIHQTGYGLTFGVHSRIPNFYQSLCARMRIGNLYINRSMIGAVVGVQPFGGEGLSGTGPKAGGPYTLLAYATERAVSINSAAIGGNIDLLMR